jgi:uncharacterized membrane protein
MSFILAIVAFVWIYMLSKRVETLESKLNSFVPPTHSSSKVVSENLSDQQISHQVPAVPVATLTPERIEEVRQQMGIPMNQEPDPFTRFIEWIRVDFMVKLGAFLLLCALGWFVSYAFMNNLIGEAGRIALGLIVGTCFLMLGYWRIRTQAHQGGIFTVLGSTTVLLTVYAARELYDFFTPLSALGLMLLSTAFVALVAVRFSSERLALAGLVLASIAPLFTNSPYPDVIERFTYLLVITFGSLWVVYLRGWSNLTFSALVVVFLHGLPYLSGIKTGDQDVVLLFTFVFTAIFFVANILGLICNENEKNRTPHLLIAGGTGLYLILWILAVAQPEWQSLLFASWMLVFSVGSFIVYRVIKQPEAFYIYGATSIALLGAATASELSGPALIIAYTLEIGALVYGALVLRKVNIASALSVLFIIPIMSSGVSLVSSDWRVGVFHESFFVLVVLMLTLGLVGGVLFHTVRRLGVTSTSAETVLLVFSGMYAVALVWLVLHAGGSLQYATATLYALLIYAIAGIGCFSEGRQTGNSTLRLVGGALIALVTARLLLYEVWNMELTGRIITFTIMGLLFLSTAFLRKSPKGSGVINVQK